MKGIRRVAAAQWLSIYVWINTNLILKSTGKNIMKHKYIHIAAAAFLLFSLNGNAAQATCNAPLGWWESKDLQPLFINPTGPAPTTDCDFHVWSWTAFVHWMQNDPATGQPLFLSLPTVDDLKSGNALRAKVGPRTLALKPRVQKPAEMSSIEQAGSNGVLVDQNGRAVYYSPYGPNLFCIYAEILWAEQL